MKLYTLTDEEGAARSLLAMPASRPCLAAVLHARFDVARLKALAKQYAPAGAARSK
jgi:hypothetical protein